MEGSRPGLAPSDLEPDAVLHLTCCLDDSALNQVAEHGEAANPVPQRSIGHAGYSWDSNDRIVFEEELDGRRSIVSTDLDGSNRKELTPTANNYDHSI
jgi:hypothetical protein